MQKWTACLLVQLFLANFPAASAAQLSAKRTEALKVTVLDGNDAINDIKSRTAAMPVVEVRDENEVPVAGAEVIFQAPAIGPGGSFPGGAATLTTHTNTQGQAAAAGFVPNVEVGNFTIKVTASSRGKQGTGSIRQRNSATVASAESTESKPRKSGRKWAILALAGAAAAGGIAAAMLGGSSSSGNAATPPELTISPGVITVAPPR